MASASINTRKCHCYEIYLLWPISCSLSGSSAFAVCTDSITGNFRRAFLWLLTLGLLGIGQIIDIFLVPSLVRQANLEDRVHDLETRRG